MNTYGIYNTNNEAVGTEVARSPEEALDKYFAANGGFKAGYWAEELDA